MKYSGKSTFRGKYGTFFEYEGELDKDKRACGKGISTNIDEPRESYECTYYNNMRHGLCMLIFMINSSCSSGIYKNKIGSVCVSEWINDDEHGKWTGYDP